jgi:hypothetical protein
LHWRSTQFIKPLITSFTPVSLNQRPILAAIFSILNRLLMTVGAIHEYSSYILVNLVLFYLVTLLQTSADNTDGGYIKLLKLLLTVTL